MIDLAPLSWPRRTGTILVVLLTLAAAACSETEDPTASTSEDETAVVADSVTTEAAVSDSVTTEAAAAETDPPSPSETSDTEPPTGSDPPVEQTGPMACQYDPDLGEPNPFGQRAFLRFEDRDQGGSAVTYESFGNALGDGAFGWQVVHLGATSTEVFERFLAGEPVTEDLLDDAEPSTDLLGDIEASFRCHTTATPALAKVEWEPSTELSTSSCSFDPELGPNPIGMRSALTVWELLPGSAFPDPTAVMVFERFGNAVGDGAGWHQTIFTDHTAADAFELLLSDPQYLSQATGDLDTTEVNLTLELIEDTYRCSN